MNKRINLEVTNIYIINKSYSLEKEFWNLWKKNIFGKEKKYKDDNYEFMCVKTEFHKI